MHTVDIEVTNLKEGDFHIFVEGSLNGHTCRMLIDTGASRTVIDQGFIQSLDPEARLKEHERKGHGIGTNTMKVETTTIKKFNIGSLEIANYETAVLDLSHVNNSYAELNLPLVYVILGSDLLLKHKALVDYGSLKLVLN